jgi:hypothetical protein
MRNIQMINGGGRHWSERPLRRTRQLPPVYYEAARKAFEDVPNAKEELVAAHQRTGGRSGGEWKAAPLGRFGGRAVAARL